MRRGGTEEDRNRRISHRYPLDTYHIWVPDQGDVLAVVCDGDIVIVRADVER